MLSSSRYTMLKLSKTTSPQKLFDYDCITLNVCQSLLLCSSMAVKIKYIREDEKKY